MPLERGLAELGRDVSGRLAALATTLGNRMSGGGPRHGAEGGAGDVPATVSGGGQAGVRAGRLPAALEGLANMRGSSPRRAGRSGWRSGIR